MVFLRGGRRAKGMERCSEESEGNGKGRERERRRGERR